MREIEKGTLVGSQVQQQPPVVSLHEDNFSTTSGFPGCQFIGSLDSKYIDFIAPYLGPLAAPHLCPLPAVWIASMHVAGSTIVMMLLGLLVN